MIYRCWDIDGETHHDADDIKADDIESAALSFAGDLDIDEAETLTIGVIEPTGAVWCIEVRIDRDPTLHVEHAAPYALPEDDE